MDFLSFLYEKTCGLSKNEFESIGKKLEPEIKRLQTARSDNYNSVYASINVPFDTDMIKQVKLLIEKKRKLKPKALVVIGIGGSNLGTIAVQEALRSTFYNEQQPDIKIYYADTVDSDYIYDIILLVEQELQQDHPILINVISKSGTTTETIANFEIFLHLLQSYRLHDYQQYVVVTTDEGSPLWSLAEAEQFDRLAIPKQIGGRYSILSAVGLFPLGLIGIDIDQLCSGASNMVEQCISSDFFENPAAISAALLFDNYKKGFIIHDMFLFCVDFYSLGMWYRQILAESIGKTEVVGITPTVSLGSIDLHSLAQLHLAGPKNTFTTFVSVEKNKSDILVPCFEKIDQLVADIKCKPLASLMKVILKGTKKAYKERELPFNEIVLPEKNAYAIGQFLQLQMIAIMYLGYLFDVNPFNQPEVELYKQETRKILAHK